MSLACGELKTTLPFMYSKIPIIPCTVRCDLQNSNSFFKAMKKITRRTSSVIIKPNVWERERERVASPEILSRVFLFHFEKILSHFDLFRDVSVNTD